MEKKIMIELIVNLCAMVIGVGVAIICGIGKLLFWVLFKSRLLYPVSWFVFTGIVAMNPSWFLYTLLIGSWFAIIWHIFGIILGLMVVVLGIRDIIRFIIPDFDWGDIPEYFKDKKLNKQFIQEQVEYGKKRRSVYKQNPQLEKEEAYFENSICKNLKEKNEFEYDWKCYIEQIYETSQFVEFANWFEENQRWKYTTYNHEYTERYKAYRESNTTYGYEKTCSSDQKENTDPMPQEMMWFKGVHSEEELTKRYKDLLKIYHPDNQTGDTEITKQIQEEYNNWLQKGIC